MLEAALPFGTILLGSGVWQLIRKITIGRRANHRRNEGDGRPRILVKGTVAQAHVCKICCGKIKEGTEYCWCRSGNVFHSSCFARMSGCPDCKRTYAIKGMESETSREVWQSFHPTSIIEEVPLPDEESSSCPVCGGHIREDADGCPACGAIFVVDGGTFICPECGARVSEGQNTCPGCGEPFRLYTPPAGEDAVLADDERPHQGAGLGERCPECGAPLDKGEEECPICGAAFEYV